MELEGGEKGTRAVQMLFKLIDGKVKKLLSNQREGGERKGPRDRRAKREK